MKQALGTREQGSGMASVVVLPKVWAVGQKRPCGSVGLVAGGQQRTPTFNALTRTQKANAEVSPLRGPAAPVEMTASLVDGGGSRREKQIPQPSTSIRTWNDNPEKRKVASGFELAFYRKYTEAMLRRYAVMSMESGRVPSMLGKEMFRGKVTNCRVTGFDDAVIFCHDVESCLKRLPGMEQKLLKRVAVQQYTHGEAAMMLGISLRSCVRHYAEAVDRLTKLLLAAKLLHPQKACQ